MPNNIRKSGAWYISQGGGNDANDGLTKDTPKATLADYGAGIHVVAGGDHEGAFNLNNNIATRTYIADGNVKILCSADMIFPIDNGACVTNFNGASYKDPLVIDLNSFAINSHTNFQNYYYTTIKGGTMVSIASIPSFYNCVLKDITGSPGWQWLVSEKSQFFNVQLAITGTGFAANGVIKDSYFDTSFTLNVPAYFSTPATQFKNNNFRGQIVVGGTPYELKKKKDGTTINPNPGVADLATIDANVYARGNFAEDPLHANIAKSDFFAVAPASPNMMADSSGVGNIGGVFAAVTTKATDAAFASPVSSLGIAASSGDLVWSAAPGNPGTLVSQPIQVSTVTGRPMKKGFIAGLLNYNSLQTIGGAKNTSVVAVQNYAGGTAGANPRRIKTIEWRAKTTLGTPSTASDYDNQTYITAGNYFASELLGLDTDFLIDVNGKGTADPAFVAAGAAYVAAVWVQFRLTIQEGIG